MWKDLLGNAALILGIAISLHTLYAIGHSYLVRSRKLRALLEELRLEFGTLLSLVTILAGKAEGFRERHVSSSGQADSSILSEEAKADLAVLQTRTRQILDSDPEWDLSKWGARLTKKQLGHLVAFLDNYRLYRTRLELRFQEYNASPSRHGALGRFVACTAMHENIPELFKAFERSLGWKPLRPID